MWLEHLKGSFYTLFFIMLNLVYLVIELSFNARILDVSAAMSPDMDYGQLELYGRTISASGATILAWRLLVPYRHGLNLFRLVIKFFLIAVIVFPLVFIGQKKLIDSLVDNSSAETRRSAEILTLLKYGIANGFVEIGELAMDELTLQTPEGKMFITLAGLLAYNSSHMREVLENKLDKIAGYAIATQQTENTEQLYKNYLYAREQVIRNFQQYQQLVNDLEEKQAASMNESIRLYEQSMNRAMLQWLDYQRAIKNNEDLQQIPGIRISLIANLLQVSSAEINACETPHCFNERLQQLQFRLSRQLGYHAPLTDWCQQREQELLGRLLDCITGADKIRQKLVETQKMTLAVQAGLSRPYASKLDFLTSTDLRSTVFSSLEEAGIQPGADWQFTRYEQLLADISDQIDARYRSEYDAEVGRLFAALLEPRTPVDEFNRIPSMQFFYRQVLPADAESIFELDLNRQGFEDLYVAPLYFSKFTMLLNKLRAGEEWYQRDSPYETSGKNSLRNLVIPPVVIAFSLIFGLLNMINLLLNFLFILIEERLWLRWLGFAILTVFMLLLPVQQTYQIYSQSAYQELLEETESSYGWWMYGLNWVAETEPLIYPLGNILRYNLLDGFNFD